MNPFLDFPNPNLSLPQSDTSLAAPFLVPPSSAPASSSSSTLLQVNISELERIKRIGSGSSSTVYKVLHRPSGELYALRVIYGNHEDSVRRQICREIEILRGVDNPNVVKCHDMFDHFGEIQVLLEFMDGGSLKGTHIHNETSLSDLSRQILSGLHYLHRHRIVHRDIKPSNLLINSRAQVKIADFGVSKILSQTMDPVNSSEGTIAYMSPERINTDLNPGGMYDGYAGDIWSLGVSILEFYLGRFPFAVGRQGDWASLMCEICLSQPPEAPPTASREFRDFIGCCLQRDPAKRWTAAQLLRHPFITNNGGGGAAEIPAKRIQPQPLHMDSSYRNKTLLQEIRGLESAKQLRQIIGHPVGDDKSSVAAELAMKISESFTESISIMKRCPSGDVFDKIPAKRIQPQPLPPPPPPAVVSSGNRNQKRRRRSDLSLSLPLPLPQRDTSLAVPFTLPPSSTSPAFSTSSTLLQVNISELDRINRIGSGSSGTVYKVLHRPSGIHYALKVIYGNHEVSVGRQICREIEILRGVDNPNIVKCHDMFYHSGEIQVLLEYMDGGSLAGTLIHDEPSLSDISRQILSGLDYLHRRKIVHRDIKPSNLLINSRKQVKIADFGVSTILSQAMDPCNSSVGTLAYMSPERINTDLNHGQLYDGYAGDIWSFGVSILEFYLGRFPFAVGWEGDWASLICAICLSQPPEAPPSREFRDFIGCCLQRDPAKRWTAAQLLGHPFIKNNGGGGAAKNHNSQDENAEVSLPQKRQREQPLLGLTELQEKGRVGISDRESTAGTASEGGVLSMEEVVQVNKKGQKLSPEGKERLEISWEKLEEISLEELEEAHSDPEELEELDYDPVEVPPTISHHFSILSALDLSYTEIKILPQSISRLVALKKLFLRSCELLMKLPPEIGELTNLEVLDLEDTELLFLPKEIAKLVNLMCLKVSFYGYANQTVIPRRVLPNLSRLNELIIDVTPHGEWWDVEVEAIIDDLCSLKELRTLKLYLPAAELLEDLTLIYPGLANFRFTLGRHEEHFISCLPHTVEEEFNNREKLEKGLKCINGNCIPNEITKVLKHANAFFLQRHWTAVSLSEFGHENMNALKFCLVMECNEFRTIIDTKQFYRGKDGSSESGDFQDFDEAVVLPSLEKLIILYMKNMESIWKGPIGTGSLSNLKSLALHTCPSLTTLFTIDMLSNLRNLEELIVEDCPKIDSLVSLKSSGSKLGCFLPSLKKISLLELPELVSISSGLFIAPKLERMVIFYCPKLEKLSTMDVSSTNLKVIKGEKEWWDALKWYESDLTTEQEDFLARLFIPLRRDGDLMAQLTKD